MAKTHNKKRNIGIIYDQMISSLCESYIENDLETSKKLLKIIKECFKKGTQLQKELQFFNSFLKMRSLPENLSSEIIREAKTASRSHFDSKQLELEKSKLIKLLNYTFGKGVIFEKTMPTKPTTQRGIKAQNSKLEKWCQNNFPNWTEINITPIN